MHDTFQVKEYVKKLRAKLLSSVKDLFADEETNMLVAAVDELTELNDGRFSQLLT